MYLVRRTLLKLTAAYGALAAAGLMRPSDLLAANWNKNAFEAKTLADALAKFGVSSTTESKDITLKVPDIAENGAVVPIEVTSKIPGTQSITIFVEKNPQPLTANYEFGAGVEAFVNTRIKMGQTSNIRIIVTAGGKHYSAIKEVRVVLGGCGG